MDLEKGINVAYGAGIDSEDKERFDSQFYSLPLSVRMSDAKGGSSVLMVGLKFYDGDNPCEWFVFENTGKPIKYGGIEKLTKERGYTVEAICSSINPVLRIKVLDGDYLNIPMLSIGG